MSGNDERIAVRQAYSEIALEAEPEAGSSADEVGAAIGYSPEELGSAPDGANLGLGCGNPLALGTIGEGEVIVDLGSGAGFDCFLAARRVGPTGMVIGIDMTPEMLERARHNSAVGGYTNVDFRLGELEALPIEDSSVDLVISNCVISLVPDRAAVYREALRVLKPGGRIAISDTLITADLPEALRDSKAAIIACLTATGSPEEYVALIESAGFTDVEVVEQAPYPVDWAFEPAVVEQLTTELGVPTEAIENAARSMISVSVVGHKQA